MSSKAEKLDRNRISYFGCHSVGEMVVDASITFSIAWRVSVSLPWYLLYST